MYSIYRACNLLFFNFVVFNLKVSVSLFWEFYFFLKKSYWNTAKNKGGLFQYDDRHIAIETQFLFQYDAVFGQKNSRPFWAAWFYRFAMRFRRSLWALRLARSFWILLATMHATSVTAIPPHKPTSKD